MKGAARTLGTAVFFAVMFLGGDYICLSGSCSGGRRRDTVRLLRGGFGKGA